MLRIGLTGGIGSGKSTVARLFQLLGIPVYDADRAARQLMNSDPELREKLIRHFGTEAYQATGLNRKYIADIVFRDQSKLQLLNSIVHPVTIRDAEQWMQQQKTPYAIKEAALLFESGAHQHLDLVIGVQAPRELRIKRVMERDQVSRDAVISRLEKQMEEDEKMKLCDLLIINNEEELVIPQVLTLHQRLLQGTP